MNEQVVFALLLELWRDLQDPAFLWQVFALGLSVLLAWGLSRYGERQEFAQASADYGALRAFSTGSLKRVAFPLLSLLFVVIVRKAFKYWQLGPVSLLDLAVPRSACSIWRCRSCFRWRWCAQRSMSCATPFLRAVGWRLRSVSLPPASGSVWRCTSRDLRHH